MSKLDWIWFDDSQLFRSIVVCGHLSLSGLSGIREDLGSPQRFCTSLDLWVYLQDQSTHLPCLCTGENSRLRIRLALETLGS